MSSPGGGAKLLVDFLREGSLLGGLSERTGFGERDRGGAST